MIGSRQFIEEASASGFDFYTGVPCSFLTPLINGVISDSRLAYVGAASEGEAVAIAAGAWLAGRQPVVMFQNSGLGNAVNPLTSLNAPFRIPALLITTWRGEPGRPDEPQHESGGAGELEFALWPGWCVLNGQVVGAGSHWAVQAAGAASVSSPSFPAWTLACSSIDPSRPGETWRSAPTGGRHVAFARIA